MQVQESVQVVDLSQNRIKSVPSKVGQFEGAILLDIHETRIETLPMELGSMQQLQTLDISHCCFSVLPPRCLLSVSTADSKVLWK